MYQLNALVHEQLAVVYECGHIFPTSICHLKRIKILEKGLNSDLPALILAERQYQLSLIVDKTARTDVKSNTNAKTCNKDR